MSLISFKVYQEMARPRYPRARRGKSDGIDASDVSRIPPNIENEDIEFLRQFEFKDYPRALRARQDMFVNEILPKLQKIIDLKIKDSGLQDSVFFYIKNGKQLTSNPLSKEVIDYIKDNFNVVEGRGLEVPAGAPSQTKLLIEGIKKLLKNFDIIGKSHLIDEDRRKELLNLINRAQEAERRGEESNLRHELVRAYKSLKRDDQIEDVTESVLYEIVKKQTTENRKFWKDNGLDPDKIRLDLTDGRTKEARSGGKREIEVNPHFYRLYHKLERTRGAEHVADLIRILGPKGNYGYDMSNPIKTGDTTTTTGTTFGSENTNARWGSFVKDWLQHYSHGHFDFHVATQIDSDNVVWLPVSIGSSEIEDPLYDWLVDGLAKDIQKEWNKGDSNLDENDPECQKQSKGKGTQFVGKSKCAEIKAEKIVKKMIADGRLHAPPVPCNSKFQEKCPTKEERAYKLDSNGEVIKPPIYIPHQRAAEGKYVPLLNPSTYLRQLDRESDGEDYEELLKKSQEQWGDSFPGEYTYKDGDEERSIRFPVWGKHGIKDDETLNMGASTFKSFGPNFNKLTKTQNYVYPFSKRGQEIIQSYLVRDPKTNMIEDFKVGILSCLGGGARTGSGCAGAPGFILDAMKNALTDVHEILYSWAMEDLLAMEPKDPEADEYEDEQGRVISRSRTTWALGKTSNIAGSPALYNLGYENYSRRLGVQNRVVNAPRDKEGGGIDFGDKGYGADLTKRRGAPTGSGLNKDARNQSIRDIILQSPEAKKAIENAAASASAAVNKIQTNFEDPFSSLEQKVAEAGTQRANFESELRRVLISLGKSDEEVDNIINQFKDDSIEQIIRVLKTSSVKTPKVRPTPIIKQMKTSTPAPTGAVSSPLARFRQRKQDAQKPAEPDQLTQDPKVDWVKFKNLTISERVKYLKNKLKD